MANHQLYMYKEIVAEPNYSALLLMLYLQLCHFYTTNKSILNLHRSLTPFETLCISEKPHGHIISAINATVMKPRMEAKFYLTTQLGTQAYRIYTRV